MADFFKEIIFLESVDSTNTFLKHEEFGDKTLVYSFNQTHGKGRNQRNWSEFKNKNLALSFLLKPDNPFYHNLWHIASASLALIDIIQNYSIQDAWIKWPNDVYVNDEKIAGILAESVWKETKIDKLIVGIGININCTKDDLSSLDNKATSFFIQTGAESDINAFFKMYNEKLSKWLELLYTEEGINIIRDKWKESCNILNKDVEWIDGKKTIEGKIINIEDDGTLILKNKFADFKIFSGEVRVI